MIIFVSITVVSSISAIKKKGAYSTENNSKENIHVLLITHERLAVEHSHGWGDCFGGWAAIIHEEEDDEDDGQHEEQGLPCIICRPIQTQLLSCSNGRRRPNGGRVKDSRNRDRRELGPSPSCLPQLSTLSSIQA